MAGASFTDLSQELLDEIVDYGLSNPAFPESCALVSRTLRPRAQKQIFGELKIYSVERVTQLLRLMQKNPRLTKYLDTIYTFLYT